MSATKRNVNWRSTQFTPTSGSATTYTGVTSVGIAMNASMLKFSGDGDRFVTTLVNDLLDPMVTVATADLASATAIAIGTIGTFSAVLKDARQQTSSSGAGDMTVTLNNAMLADNSFSGQYRQYAQANVSFACYSTDGVTSPLTVSFA